MEQALRPAPDVGLGDQRQPGGRRARRQLRHLRRLQVRLNWQQPAPAERLQRLTVLLGLSWQLQGRKRCGDLGGGRGKRRVPAAASTFAAAGEQAAGAPIHRLQVPPCTCTYTKVLLSGNRRAACAACRNGAIRPAVRCCGVSCMAGCIDGVPGLRQKCDQGV